MKGDIKNCITCNTEIYCYDNCAPICDSCFENRFKDVKGLDDK